MPPRARPHAPVAPRPSTPNATGDGSSSSLRHRSSPRSARRAPGLRRVAPVHTRPAAQHRHPVGPRSASSSLWVMSTTAPPDCGERARPAAVPPPRSAPGRRWARRAGGSAHRAASAFTISSRCCSATGSVPARAPGSSGRLSRSRQRGRRAAASSRGPHSPPARARRSPPPSARERREVLVHHADARRARIARGLRSRRGAPSTRISPASGAIRPYATCISVVLPAPFSPSSACTSPGSARRDRHP